MQEKLIHQKIDTIKNNHLAHLEKKGDNVYKLYNAFTTVLRDYKAHAVTNPKRNFTLLELLSEVT